MDRQRVKLVNRGTGSFVVRSAHPVLDRGRVRHKHTGSVLALGEHPIQEILDLEAANLRYRRYFRGFSKGQVLFLLGTGLLDGLNGSRGNGRQFEDGHPVLFEQFREGRFVKGVAAEPSRVLDEQVIDAVAERTVGLGETRRGGGVIRREHDNGHARLAGVERIEDAKTGHCAQEEVGGLRRKVGDGHRRIRQLHDELQELVVGTGGIDKGGFGEPLAEGFMLGIAINGGNGYSGKPRPGEEYFKNKGLADASARLETGDETVEYF